MVCRPAEVLTFVIGEFGGFKFKKFVLKHVYIRTWADNGSQRLSQLVLYQLAQRRRRKKRKGGGGEGREGKLREGD